MMRWRAALLRDFWASLSAFDWSELRYVSSCGYWPFAVYVVICVGSIVLVLLLASLALLPGLNASWQLAQEQSAALEFERAALRHQVDTNSAKAASMSRQCAYCPMLHRRLRPADPMPVVVDRLSAAAAARGVAIVELRPEKSWQQSSVQAFDIDIQMRADMHQLAAFLGDIAAMPFTFVIRQADFQIASSQGRLVLFLLVDGNGGPRVSNAFKAADPDGAQLDITRITSPDPQSAADTRWQRVAFIQRGNRYLEVLRDPHGETRRRAGKVGEVAP